MSPGQRFLFTAVALDAAGSPVTGVGLRWRVTNPAAGSLNSTGVFTAGSVEGTYAYAVTVEAVFENGSVSTSATVVTASQTLSRTGPFDTLVVYPPRITVKPGQVVGLGALGWDSRGRFVPNLKFEWSVVERDAGQIDQLGFFTAVQTSGLYPDAIQVLATQATPDDPIERRAFVSVTVSELARKGVLDRIVVVPGRVILTPSQRVSFFARAFDEGGKRLRGVSYTWELAEPQAGEVEQTGLFIAGPDPGKFPTAIRVVAKQGASIGVVQVGATVAVTIKATKAPEPLASALLSPVSVTLRPGQRFIFNVFGVDASGEAVPTKVTWRVSDPDAGSFGRTGVFTAGTKPGSYPDALIAELVQEEGETPLREVAFATVNISGPLVRVEILPETATVQVGGATRFRVVGYDALGFGVSELNLKWHVEDPRAGEITDGGIFIAGSNPGRYENVIKVTAQELKPR